MIRALIATMLLAVTLSLGAASAAIAGAPEPRAAVDLDRLMGRWNEIYRTPNKRQNACVTAYQVWSRQKEAFTVVQHCVRANGRVGTFDTTARDIDPDKHAKFEASFLGGLLKNRYWVLDHDKDYSWMIASTADGKYVSILARTTTLPEPERTALLARAADMGLNTAKLQNVEPKR